MKKLIIFGGSKGIGRSIVETFRDRGFHCLNISRTLSAPADSNMRVDLSNIDDIDKVRTSIIEYIKDATELSVVHNAFPYSSDSALSPDLNKLNEAFNACVIWPTSINQMVVEKANCKTSILFTGSTLSEKAVPGAYSYSTLKHACAGMMKALCQDGSGNMVHTALICPGFTDTEMLREHLNRLNMNMEMITDNVIFNRLIRPDEIARFFLFAHEEPSLNGSVLHANLGQKTL